jgi:leucyl aminopeptidase (aminopeptidase T)
MPESPSKLQREAARYIVTKYLGVRAGESAIIESWDHTIRMATAMVDEVRRRGGTALLIHENEDAWWRAIDRKQSKLLGKSSPPEWAALRAADVYVMFWGPGDTDRIEKDHFSGDEKAFDEALAWNWPWYEVARKSGLRGARMTAGFVTEGRARKWGMDPAVWEEGMLRACLVDPAEMAKSGARLCQALSRGKKVRITHPNGTDLEVALAGVAPRLHEGRPHPRDRRYGPYDMLAQIPAGRVDVALDSRVAEGTILANRRTNIWWHSQAGGKLGFVDGKLTSFSFEEGEEDFSRQYKRGRAGRDRATKLTFGLNPAAKEIPNLETVERGCVTLEFGGITGSNFMSWVSLADSEIAIDGTPVVRAGALL